MGRSAKGTLRRKQIIRGLMQVMAERGYEGASIAEIAKAAGLNAGLIHYYFENKQQILLALMQYLMRGVQLRYERRLAEATSEPWERLFAFIDAYVALGDDADPASVACWVGIGAEAIRQPEVQTVYERIVRDIMEQLKLHLTEVLAAEGRSTRQVHPLAAALFAAIEGAYQLATVAPSAIPPGFASPTFKQMARGLLLDQPPRHPNNN